MIATARHSDLYEPIAADDRLTVEDAAPIAGMSAHTMYRAIRVGHVPPGVFYRIGRNLRISKSRLLQWIDAGGTSHAA